MEKFLESYNLIKLTQEEIENLCIPNSTKELNQQSKMKKTPCPDGLPGGFQQIYKEKLTKIFLILFQEI